MSGATIAKATANSVEKNQTQVQENPPPLKKSSLYTLNATKIAQNAQVLAYTGVALLAIASFPGAAAGPCEATQAVCIQTCMAMGGPDPRETGACIIGCKLAYWVCKAGAAYMGWPG